MFPNLFARWRKRDAEARTAEDSVLAASLRALDRRGTPPSIEKLEKAKQLRQGANALLDAAFAEVKNLTGPPAGTTGAAKNAVGKVQQKTGEATGSTEQQGMGPVKQVEGTAQKAYGDVKAALKNPPSK